MIAVIGGPAEVTVVVLFRDGILRLIPADVDERKGLLHSQRRFPLDTRMRLGGSTRRP